MLIISDKWYPSYTQAFYAQIEEELDTSKKEVMKMEENMIEKQKREKIKQRRHSIVEESIESGHPAHVRYISPLPRGDGKIHSVKGRVVSQDDFYMFVRRLHSGKVRVLKNQMFMVSHCVKRNKRRKPGKTKDMDMIGL